MATMERRTFLGFLAAGLTALTAKAVAAKEVFVEPALLTVANRFAAAVAKRADGTRLRPLKFGPPAEAIFRDSPPKHYFFGLDSLEAVAAEVPAKVRFHDYAEYEGHLPGLVEVGHSGRVSVLVQKVDDPVMHSMDVLQTGEYRLAFPLWKARTQYRASVIVG